MIARVDAHARVQVEAMANSARSKRERTKPARAPRRRVARLRDGSRRALGRRLERRIVWTDALPAGST
jgi:hypothetical protein